MKCSPAKPPLCHGFCLILVSVISTMLCLEIMFAMLQERKTTVDYQYGHLLFLVSIVGSAGGIPHLIIELREFLRWDEQ